MLAWSLPSWFPGTRQPHVKALQRKLDVAHDRLNKMMVRARYDAAQTTSENRKHWSMADGLSARAANSLGIRQTLRNRARYESANNSYCAGMLLTLANDMVGTGPRLQMHTANKAGNEIIEREFIAWCKAIKLPQKLRAMRVTRARDGEAFAVLTTNPKLPTPVQLDVRTVEADQVTSPQLDIGNPLAIDGIRFDEHGNPREYDILPHHPGDDIALPNWTPEVHPADQVIHWFRVDRPGQLRGIPEITPSLPLYAHLRRFTLAVISTAELAANLSGVFESNAAAPEDGDGEESLPWEEIEITRNAFLTLPGGTKLNQLKAEQPTTTYGMFKQEILNEIARCLNMPYNVAAGNSAGYNYSSGRLDHQIYFRSVGIDQQNCESEVLDRLFAAWLEEAALIPGYLPPVEPFYLLNHSWSWDPAEDLDPVKSAQARLINLQAGMTSYQAEFARQGLDWEVEQGRQAEALGVDLKTYRNLLRQKMLGVSAPLMLRDQESVTAKLRRRVRRLNRVVASLSRRLGA